MNFLNVGENIETIETMYFHFNVDFENCMLCTFINFASIAGYGNDRLFCEISHGSRAFASLFPGLRHTWIFSPKFVRNNSLERNKTWVILSILSMGTYILTASKTPQKITNGKYNAIYIGLTSEWEKEEQWNLSAIRERRIFIVRFF